MPTKKPISVAMLGNPNVGKSVLFNTITGAAQLIGNWCGKTTTACTVKVRYADRDVEFTDLPGIYGFGRSSTEEAVVDKHLATSSTDVIIVIVDVLNLERNLYLALESLERHSRIVVVLNKMDAATEHGMVIDHSRLAASLGVPVIPIAATKNFTAATLYESIFDVADGKYPLKQLQIRYPDAIEDQISATRSSQEARNGKSDRWLALKEVEHSNEATQIEIINTRYATAAALAAETIIAHLPTKSLSDKLDYWALHRYAGVPIMLAVFAVLFFLTFTVSRPMSELIGDIFINLRDILSAFLPSLGMPPLFTDLIINGLLAGIGATLGFLPQIAIFFLVYHLIQDSGYIVRVAFLMDRVMSAIGLNGKIFIPLVAGYSCNVNGILASRMLTSRYDRMVAVLASSYAPCSARLGVMVFMVSAFFPSFQATLVMLALLVISTAMMAFVAYLVKFFVKPDESSMFMTEVPVYNMPNIGHLLSATAGRTLHFLKRIRNVIIFSSLIMWFLSSFPIGPFEDTYIARVGQALEPFGALLGLDWRLIVALIAGVPAKESALTALGVIYHTASDGGNLGHVLASQIPPLGAFTFLVVYMTYIPCLATVITIYQEMRSWSAAVFSVWGGVAMAFLLGLLSYNIGYLIWP